MKTNEYKTITEAARDYMRTNNLESIPELWFVVEYDVEVLSNSKTALKMFDKIDQDKLLNDIEQDGIVTLITTDEKEAAAALEGKHSNYYEHGGITYKEGFATFGYEITYDADFDEVEFVCNLGDSEAPTRTPFWEKKYISLDGGETFQTADEAIEEITERDLWEQVLECMDAETRDWVSFKYAPYDNLEFLEFYLDSAPDDLIIG